VLGIYDAAYDPEIGTQVLDGNVMVSGIFAEATWRGQAIPESARLLRDLWRASKEPLWILDPVLFHQIGRQMVWGPDFALRVVRPILQLIQRKRTMKSLLRLPDGEASFPGIAIPPYDIVTEELGWGAVDRPRILDIVNTALTSGSGGPGSARKGGGETILSQAGRILGTDDNEGRADMAAYRKAQLCSFDLNNDRLDTFSQLDFDQLKYIKKAQLSALLKPSLEMKVVGGVDHIAKLIEEDDNLGLSYMYRLLQPDIKFPVPSNRADLLRPIVSQSPVLLRVIELAKEHCFELKERLVIACDQPWIQQ
jgi:hypothetical protein